MQNISPFLGHSLDEIRIHNAFHCSILQSRSMEYAEHNRFSATVQIIQINYWHMKISRQRDEYLENKFACCESKCFPKKFKKAHVILAEKKILSVNQKSIWINQSTHFHVQVHPFKKVKNFKMTLQKVFNLILAAHFVGSNVMGKNKVRKKSCA